MGDLLGLKLTELIMPLIIMGLQLLLQIGLRLLQGDDVFLLGNQELILSLHLKPHCAHQILKLRNLVVEFLILF